jgi:ABC-2 type transport system permease protein
VSGAVPVAIVIAVLALTVWRRGRRRSTRNTSHTRRALVAPLLLGDTGLVAAREVRARIRGRIFRVGTLLILAGVAAAIVIPVLNGGKHPDRVGVVGALSAPLRAAILNTGMSIRTTVDLVPEADVRAAHDDLRSGRISLAILDGRDIVVNKAIGSTDTSTTAQLVRALSTTLGVDEALAAAGLSPAQVEQLARAKPLPVASLQPGAAKGTAHTTSLVGLILLFVMLTQYGTWTLIGVMEEKSSRVVEVLLATVRPVQLVGGKVLGIGLVVFAQAALIVAFALGLAEAVGSDLLHGATPLLIASTLVWVVLGYAFYCWVYAAAGSMASRQDQVQSLALPLNAPIVFAYVFALITAASGSPSTFFKVLAYLPPTAPFAMPVLVGLGDVTWWEFAASAAISILCTVGVAKLATNIYRRAILRTGRRVRLREVISGASR